jgi:dienelactone hydrolase
VFAGFAQDTGAADAVVVGWSLGGHIALEAAPAMPAPAGYVVFGTPPVASAAQMGEAFLLPGSAGHSLTHAADTAYAHGLAHAAAVCIGPLVISAILCLILLPAKPARGSERP